MDLVQTTDEIYAAAAAYLAPMERRHWANEFIFRVDLRALTWKNLGRRLQYTDIRTAAWHPMDEPQPADAINKFECSYRYEPDYEKLPEYRRVFGKKTHWYGYWVRPIQVDAEPAPAGSVYMTLSELGMPVRHSAAAFHAFLNWRPHDIHYSSAARYYDTELKLHHAIKEKIRSQIVVSVEFEPDPVFPHLKMPFRR
jgi:hypothetical protein